MMLSKNYLINVLMLRIFKKIIFLSFLLFLFIFPLIIRAQINFQQGVNLPGFTETQVQESTLAKYVSALYKWAIIAIAVFAVLMIVNAGFGMVLNSGNVSKVAEQRDNLFRAVIGLVLALVAIPMLNMISPALVRLSSLTIGNITKESETTSSTTIDPSLVCQNTAEHNCGEVFRQTIGGKEIVCCGTKCSQGYGCASVTGGDPLGGVICPPGDFVYRVCQKTDNPQCNGGDCSLERKCNQTCCGGTKVVPCYCPENKICPCDECDPIKSCVGVMCE
jgi:hypothetical protein